jgi:hypothetical protein
MKASEPPDHATALLNSAGVQWYANKIKLSLARALEGVAILEDR